MERNYFNFVLNNDDTFSPEGEKLFLRSMANWCNGNLLGITRVRLANFEKTGNHDDDGKQITDPDVARSMPNGPQMTPTQRGSLFASLRAECFNIAEERNLKDFDVPREFKEYLEGRATGFRKHVPTKAEIKLRLEQDLGITEDRAMAGVMRSNAEEAAKIEDQKENLVSEDGSYDDNIDVDEVFGRMSFVSQHRWRVKFLDAILYECDRLLEALDKFPNFQELRGKRTVLLKDAITVETELKQFEKEYRNELDKEMNGTETMLTTITPDHKNILWLVKKQLKEKQAA